MLVYIGYDPREIDAYSVAENSLKITSGIDCTPLCEESLRACGLYTRPVDKRIQPYDIISNASCATDFSSSRFLVPLLCQYGWALFVDCDMVFVGDVNDILRGVDKSKAIYVVKHPNGIHKDDKKMCGLEQTSYLRKNWSSVMLFNCDHTSNRRLSLRDVNERPGRDLHRFYWLDDSEIGELDPKWNWLVNVRDKPKDVKIAHFTLGGPWFESWVPSDNDDIWLKAYGELCDI